MSHMQSIWPGIDAIVGVLSTLTCEIVYAGSLGIFVHSQNPLSR